MAPRKHTLYWKSLAGMKYSRIFLDEPDKTVRRPAEKKTETEKKLRAAILSDDEAP